MSCAPNEFCRSYYPAPSSRRRMNCRRNIASSSAHRPWQRTPISDRAWRGTSPKSTGGLFGFEQAQRQCVRMLESGPAAGVVATQAICREARIENAIAFDMGGTTAKAGVIAAGHLLTTGTGLVGGYERSLPVQIPM